MKKATTIILSALILLSCHKDPVDEPQSCTKSITDISGSYKITGATYKANASAPEIDYYEILLELCERDDVYTFKTDGTYQIADIGLVCSPPGDSDGTWAVHGDIMQIDGDPVNLESFDCTFLILVNTDTAEPGDRLKLTLSKQ